MLSKYLKLRYTLMPYIYSLAHQVNETGAPYMRPLWMDFGQDERVADIREEYMFGPSLLVAPVTEQGATTRSVYLPAGTDWYNFWTHARLHGGQTVMVEAPIDILPIFVRAGAILPMGSEVESTDQKQSVTTLQVYAGASGSFTLYADDGSTYAYEQGAVQTAQIKWNDRAGKLDRGNGQLAASLRDAQVEVIR